ncbi:hypothetical protein ACFL6U_12155 [Planctomycetota bacterium]
MSQQSANLLKEFRSGSIQASVWENITVENGQTKRRRSVKIQKQYRDEEGVYKDTKTFFRDDIPRLILVAQKAYEHIALTESKDAMESLPV